MVGNIKKGMMSGAQMLTEPKVTWRQGIGEAIVGAVDKATQAKQQFDEREKNLVWNRLDLEAANLQAEELANIGTADSLEKVLEIKKDFENKIKANMDGQKWGKEWIEQKGSSYFTANQNDVAKAFRAKEKELIGIQMDETLKAFASQMANADPEQEEMLKQRAYAMIDQDGKGLFSPEEMQKTKNSLDSLVVTKRNDIIRQQKWAIEQEKIALNQQIADLATKAIDGNLTREELDMAKKNGVFKYAPSKYNEILTYKDKQDSNFPNDEATIQYIKDNWDSIEEKQLQKFNRDGLINNSTYNHYSSQLKKIKGGSGKGKDTEKAEIGKALLDRVRAGEDVSADLTEAEATGQITTAQATAIRNEQKRIQGFSETTKTAINDIKAGKITEDAQINDLGLPNKDEIAYVKGYLKDHLSAQTNKITQDFDDISRDVINGDIASVQVLKDDPRFDSFNVERQKELIKGVEDVQKAKVEKVISDGKEQIRKNWIKDNQELNEYILQNDLPVEQAEDLREFMTTWKNDKYGIFKDSITFAESLLPKGDSPAEIQARKDVENYIKETFEGMIDKGLSVNEMKELLSKEKIYEYVNSKKPTEETILKSINSLQLASASLDEEFNSLLNYNKDTKTYSPKSDDINGFLDYMQKVEAARVQNQINEKEYLERKQKMAPYILQQVRKMEDKDGEKTILGDIYRAVIGEIGADNVSDVMRADIVSDIALKMKGAGVKLDVKRSFVGKATGLLFGDMAGKKYDADKGGYNVYLPSEIMKQVVAKYLYGNVDSAIPTNVDKVVVGNRMIQNPLSPNVESKGVVGTVVDMVGNRWEEMKQESSGGFLKTKEQADNGLANFWSKGNKVLGTSYDEMEKPAGLKNVGRGIFGK